MCGLHDPKSGGDVTCQGSCVVLHKKKKCTKHLEWEFLTHGKNPINGFHMILTLGKYCSSTDERFSD